MRLIVWKDSDTRHKYAHKLVEKLRQGVNYKNIMEVDCSVVKSIEFLRGYTFDEVLWVGYEDGLEKGYKAPLDLLAQTHGAKHHYCKPAESNFDKAMTTNSLRFGRTTMKDEAVDALRYAMPMKIKVNKKDILVREDDSDDWDREYFASGAKK